MTTSPMNTTVDSVPADTPLARGSIINWLSLFCLCLASALLTASVVLIHQYKLGIPYTLVASLTIATIVGVVVPALLTWTFVHFKPSVRRGGFYAFLIINLILSIAISLLIF